jgi:glycolate oxidase FAD binding subunit
MSVAALAIEEVARGLRAGGPVVPRAGGTKTALTRVPAGARVLDVSSLRGILEYRPEELTFTALAGTPVAEVASALGEHGQHLPFDPLLVDAGATLGGTVASGAAGPGSHRHGGVRDYILGVRMLDGTGRMVRGGGKVVKNAAGFDLPKLVVGSIGRLGVLVELTFKVFPRPSATRTLLADLATLDAALDAVTRIALGPLEVEAVELEPPGRLWLRLAGPPATLDARSARLAESLGVACTPLDGDGEAEAWRIARELAWRDPQAALVKISVGRSQVAALDSVLAQAGAQRRYGARVAWVGWPGEQSLALLDVELGRLGLAGMVLLAPDHAEHGPLLGRRDGGAFAARVRRALDPDDRFLEV